ncbi:hypothetical protein V6N13_023637 [Hibiscus sabdariffa]|uniref:Uncharacterized protein n=1 Tax=Hibiscus sabdariffa TaxID=183260 RepID=A0ABR2PME1_9ROSI
MSSEWNDAKKWTMTKQNVQTTNAKKNAFQNQANRVAVESANCDHRLLVNRVADAKTVAFCHPAMQMPFDKFSFIPFGAQSRELTEMVLTVHFVRGFNRANHSAPNSDIFSSLYSRESGTNIDTLQELSGQEMKLKTRR